MEEMHRTHKEVPFGWVGALMAAIAEHTDKRGNRVRTGVSHRALNQADTTRLPTSPKSRRA